MAIQLRIGDPAPSFQLINHEGQIRSLADLTKNRALLLAFYPGDFTLVCTKQLCSYQDMISRFSEFGVDLAGISPNSAESHQRFRSDYGFAFPLFSDPTKEIFKSFGVTSFFMFGGTSRAVFIIDRADRGNLILYRYVEPTVLTHRKPGELLTALTDLKRNGRLT